MVKQKKGKPHNNVKQYSSIQEHTQDKEKGVWATVKERMKEKYPWAYSSH